MYNLAQPVCTLQYTHVCVVKLSIIKIFIKSKVNAHFRNFTKSLNIKYFDMQGDSCTCVCAHVCFVYVCASVRFARLRLELDYSFEMKEQRAATAKSC